MFIYQCPHCGERVEINIAPVGQPVPANQHIPLELPNARRPQPTPRRSSTTFQSSTPSPFRNDAAAIPMSPPVNYQAERQSPAFLPTRESNVIVPLFQAGITGLMFGLAGGVIVFYIGSEFGPMSVLEGLRAGFTFGGVVAIGVTLWQWMARTNEYSGLLWHFENITGLDVNQDGNVGKPEPRTIRVEVEQGKSRELEDLPGDEAALIEFARGVVSKTVTFSEDGASATGYGVTNFNKLREKFFNRNWAEWRDPKNHNQGIKLYRAGKTILTHIAETPVNGDNRAGMSNQYVEHGSKDQSWG